MGVSCAQATACTTGSSGRAANLPAQGGQTPSPLPTQLQATGGVSPTSQGGVLEVREGQAALV